MTDEEFLEKVKVLKAELELCNTEQSRRNILYWLAQCCAQRYGVAIGQVDELFPAESDRWGNSRSLLAYIDLGLHLVFLAELMYELEATVEELFSPYDVEQNVRGYNLRELKVLLCEQTKKRC